MTRAAEQQTLTHVEVFGFSLLFMSIVSSKCPDECPTTSITGHLLTATQSDNSLIHSSLLQSQCTAIWTKIIRGKQVTWLVVTDVWSECFRLVTERRHYNASPIYASCSYVAPVYLSSSSVVLRTLSALCTCSTFGHYPHPLGYPCAKFHLCCAPHCWARLQRKITYSITHSLKSLTQLIWYAEKQSLSLRNMP